MTLAQWIVKWSYRTLSDQALGELFEALAKEDEDGAKRPSIPEQERPGERDRKD